MCHPEVPAGTPTPNVTAVERAVPLTSGEMPGLLALPARAPAPGVLIVNDFYGRSPFYENLARRLAQAGFVGFTPEYFHRLPALTQRTPEQARARRANLDDVQALDDLGRGIDWLKTQPEVAGRPVGIIGFCLGGTFVLNLAALKPKVGAAVCYYGFPAAQGATGGAPRPLDQAAEMSVPLLGFWGVDDAAVGMDNVEDLRRRLTAAGKDHEFHVYAGLGHGFLAAYLEDPSAPGYDVACNSWTRTLAFYWEKLGAAG